MDMSNELDLRVLLTKALDKALDNADAVSALDGIYWTHNLTGHCVDACITVLKATQEACVQLTDSNDA